MESQSLLLDSFFWVCGGNVVWDQKLFLRKANGVVFVL